MKKAKFHVNEWNDFGATKIIRMMLMMKLNKWTRIQFHFNFFLSLSQAPQRIQRIFFFSSLHTQKQNLIKFFLKKKKWKFIYNLMCVWTQSTFSLTCVCMCVHPPVSVYYSLKRLKQEGEEKVNKPGRLPILQVKAPWGWLCPTHSHTLTDTHTLKKPCLWENVAYLWKSHLIILPCSSIPLLLSLLDVTSQAHWILRRTSSPP